MVAFRWLGRIRVQGLGLFERRGFPRICGLQGCRAFGVRRMVVFYYIPLFACRASYG